MHQQHTHNSSVPSAAKRRKFGFSAALALGLVLAACGARAGHAGDSPPRQEPAAATADPAAAADPFAALLEEHPLEVIKTGPTCSVVKMKLPPGVTPEDIPNF